MMLSATTVLTRVDEIFEERRGLALLLRSSSYTIHIISNVLEEGGMERQHFDVPAQDMSHRLQYLGIGDAADFLCRPVLSHNQVWLQRRNRSNSSW